jgi:O-antigen ligase
MKLSKAISPSSPRFQEIEFSLLLGWALLFPAKFSYTYYFGFMCLLTAFVLGKVPGLKNIALDRFSLFLLAFNSVFIFSAFFSSHPYKSLLFSGDIFLVSLWFMLFYLEKEDMERYLRLAAYVVSLSSLVVIGAFILQGGRLPVTAVFKDPVMQGIASALAVLIFLHGLLLRYRHADLLLLALNAGAVAASASMEIILGLAVFAAAMLMGGKRRRLASLFPILLLLVLVPGIMRRMDTPSLYENTYEMNRLDTWSMAARMFRHHPWTGVGPDLFTEAAPRFNFPQEKAPARYGQVPKSPRSDYWKIISETGLSGLVFILAFLFLAIRRLLPLPGPGLPEWLLAFMLTGMLLFNFVFHFFFLIIFFLLLREFFSAGRRFTAPRPGARAFVLAFLPLALFTLYLLPFLADRSLNQAAGEKDPVRRFALLRRAARLSPLDERAPLAMAEMLRAFARSRSDPAAWSEALENARLSQRLDGNGIGALILESELFRDVQVRGFYYPALAEEILAPLRRAEELDPFNPFLKLQEAAVLRRFGRTPEARCQAEAALALEPDYAAAILFIHDLDGLPISDPALQKRIALIRAKAAALRARPGSYLFQLHQLPVPGAPGN